MTTKTVPLLMLNNELHRLKRESGIRDEETALYLGCGGTKISRIMNMASRPSVSDVKMMAELYGASPDLIDVMLDLARNLGKQGDWSGYKSVYEESTRMLIELEAHCDRLLQTIGEIIPGLLQTEDYVRALCRLSQPFDVEVDEDEAVHARLHRQKLLEHDATASFILCESALRRVYGDPRVMRDQLQHLMQVAQKPNVQIQVRPFATPVQTRFAWLPFTLVHVPGQGVSAPLDFVHLEHFDDTRYIDNPELVAGYDRLWSALQAAALGPTESLEFIGRMAEEYSESPAEGTARCACTTTSPTAPSMAPSGRKQPPVRQPLRVSSSPWSAM